MGMHEERRRVASLAFSILLAYAGLGSLPGPAEAQSEAIAEHRLELRPFAGAAFWPHSTTLAFVGGDAAFRVTAGFVVGVDGAVYAPFDGNGGAHPTYPLGEAAWSADLDFLYVPFVARRRPGDETGAFELYLLGGVGVVATRPIAVVDPTRSFGNDNDVDFTPGLGARFFVSRLFAVNVELRDLLYFEKDENPQITGDGRNPATWYSPNTRFASALQLRVGASFFVP